MKKLIFLTLLFSLIFMVAFSNAQINRPYEPIIITGDTLGLFLNQKIDDLYLFSYNASENSWRLIPFQIDEVNSAVDDSVKYFISEDSLQGIFDSDDELIFMAADLGDKANDSSWVAETDSQRVEIMFTDPLNENAGYVYLYFSTLLNEPIPNYFGMTYDSLNDRVHSKNYEVGFNNTGQLGDVLIEPAIGGSGEDIFDRFKLRAFASLLWFFTTIDEDSFKMKYAYVKNNKGPVRIIRNMIGHFVLNLKFLDYDFSFDEGFTQTSFFYPWNGSFKLVEIPVGELKNFGAKLDFFRVSWDLNQQAEGMHYYSENNKDGIIIDGVKDSTNNSCFPDELNWTLATGNQGSLLNIFYIPPFGDNIDLYYHEAKDGSTGEDYFLIFDSGDFLSFSDNGFLLYENILDSTTEKTTFNFDFYNFFLPPDFDPDSASIICEQMKTPLGYITKNQKYTSPPTNVRNKNMSKPNEFKLVQNYPNPFNSSTTISFVLTVKTFVSLKIYDSLGRLVNTLTEQNLTEGKHKFKWNGKNDDGVSVPTGIYFYRLFTNKFSAVRKLLLIK